MNQSKAGPPSGRNPRGIFISYRRSDSRPWTGRLADDLRDYFGHDRVYLDLDSNRPAQDYSRQIEEALRKSRAVIAVLGPTWLDSRGVGHYDRRLDDPDDLVRRELESALSTGIALIVVLVGGAVVPSAADMPLSLRPLTQIQALRMADEDWDYDKGRLLEALERHGVLPSTGNEDTSPIEWRPTKLRRYERTFQASRRRAFDGVIGAVEALGYKERRVVAEAAQVSFKVTGRTITVKVIDSTAGYSTVVVEFPSVKTGLLAAGSAGLAVFTSGLSLVVWPALRTWESEFAKGFLDNVGGVLEGRGVGKDSAMLGLKEWLNRNRQV